MKSRLSELPVVTSDIKFHVPLSLDSNIRTFDKNNNFLYVDYRAYRENMIKRIDKEKITSSFIELRELGASLRSLIMQPDNIDGIITDFETKSQLKQETETEKLETINRTSNLKVPTQTEMKKESKIPKNLEISTNNRKLQEAEVNGQEEENFIEYKKAENLKKILGNLELYLSSNLKEIKDFRDAMSKQDKGIHQSINKFADESYENTPLASNVINERATFLKKIANLQDDNVNVFLNDLDKLTEEISLIENKANQMEINKLISKIKTLSSKEDKSIGEISNLEKSISKINEIVQKICLFLKVDLSACFNDEEINRNINDYRSKFEYKEALLMINEEIIAFCHSFLDEEPFFQFDYTSISDMIQIFNNKFTTNIFLGEERKDDKKKASLEFNNNQFSGFQIKFWSDGVLKAIYLKCPTFENFQKLDQVLFIFNMRRNMRPNEFIYKNPKYPMYFGGQEEFVSFSNNSLPKMQSNVNIQNSEGQLPEGSPLRKDKKSILNFDNNNMSIKKKKVTHFQLNEMRTNPSIMLDSWMRNEERKNDENKRNDDNKKNEDYKKKDEIKKNEENKKHFDPEANYQNYLEAPEKEKRDSVMEMTESKRKLLELELADQVLMLKKEKIFKDPDYQFSKARKNLMNGYIFLKYGKMGEPHERLIMMSSEKNLLESKSFNIKGTSKKSFELDKLKDVLFDKAAGNFQRFHKDKNGESFRFSLVFQGNKRLDLESNSEFSKKNFLDSLEICMNKIKDNGEY